MSSGAHVLSLHIARAAAAMMETRAAVQAVAGRGLEFDRYWSASGTFSNYPGAGRQLTLIESEALAALRQNWGIELQPAQTRRNVVTRGVALNQLLGKEFAIGPVRVRGIRLCEPCAHMEALSVPGTRRGLLGRGGLRADIVSDGTIRVGDWVWFDPQ